MNKVISLAEIQEKFEPERALIENNETGEGLKIKSGKVLWHGK